MLPDDSSSFEFAAGKADHTGGEFTIYKIDEDESILSLDDVADAALEYFSGKINWDNYGRGTIDSYVFLGKNNCDSIYDVCEEYGINGVRFDVYGSPQVVDESDNSVTIRVDFQVKNFRVN